MPVILQPRWHVAMRPLARRIDGGGAPLSELHPIQKGSRRLCRNADLIRFPASSPIVEGYVTWMARSRAGCTVDAPLPLGDE